MPDSRRPLTFLLLAVMVACFEARERPTIPVFGDLVVISDPPGASIRIDGIEIGETTPANLTDVTAGDHQIELSLQAGPNEFFGWEGPVTVSEYVLDTLDAALQGGCGVNCDSAVDRGRVLCRTTTFGDTCAGVFFSEPALIWPDLFGGSYAAGGRLLVAGILESDAGRFAGDTLSTQVYRDAWVGRHSVTVEDQTRMQQMDLSYWNTARFHGESLLGLSVAQTVVAADSGGAEDILFLRFEITNISHEDRYRHFHPDIPEGGYTYRSLYLGFGLDADVGVAEDDLGTFDHDLGLAFMYDADFNDPDVGIYDTSPGLIGLLTVEPPGEASERTLTLWRAVDDWDDGLFHDFAWRLLAGRLAASDPISDHVHPDIGYQPTAAGDYRVIDAHGPLVLAPGDTIFMTVAIIMAGPTPGSYTPGQVVRPGDPMASGRRILTIAGELRALAARASDLWQRFQPVRVD